MYKKNYTTAKWLVPPPLIICPDKPVGVQSTVSYRYSDSVLVPRYQVLLTVKGVPAMYLFNQAVSTCTVRVVLLVQCPSRL